MSNFRAAPNSALDRLSPESGINAHLLQRRPSRHQGHMTKITHDDDRNRLEEYLLLCQEIFERLEREKAWPWKGDSTKAKDSIESESNPQDV